MRAVIMRRFGGPEVLSLEEVPDPEPRRTEVLLNVTRSGINYADIHVRENTYLSPVELPYIPGNEVVGTTPEGKRVVALTQGGGYAEKVAVRRTLHWEIPDSVSDQQAVPLALQGNTAWHLLFTVARVAEGEKVVISAAGGGVGSLAVQLATQVGAKVIALASTEEKRQLALNLGASAVVDSTAEEDLTDRIREAAGGPVHAALEMTGGSTLHQIVAALAPRGRLAVYGFASGELTNVPVHTVLQNSITVAGFWLPHLYAAERGTLLARSTKGLFAAVSTGSLKVIDGGTYPLGDAEEAHRTLGSRSATGKVSLDTGK